MKKHLKPEHKKAVRYTIKITLLIFVLLTGLSRLGFFKQIRFAWSEIPLFKTKYLEIIAEEPIVQSQVKKILKAQAKDKNLFHISSIDLSHDFKKISWVDTVKIRKKFPSSLIVTLTSKKSFAIFKASTKKYFVDEKGEVIDEIPAKEIISQDIPTFSIKKQHTFYQWDQKKSVHLIKELKKEFPIVAHFDEIIFETYPYFSIQLKNPKAHILLQDQTWKKQLKMLPQILNSEHLTPQKLASIILTLEKKAVVTP